LASTLFRGLHKVNGIIDGWQDSLCIYQRPCGGIIRFNGFMGWAAARRRQAGPTGVVL
jgi:hypothetical protein